MTFFCNTFKHFYIIKDRQAIVFLDTFFAPLSLLHSCPRNLQVTKLYGLWATPEVYNERVAKNAKNHFQQNRYSDLVLTGGSF